MEVTIQGDGITDVSSAIQSAIDQGINVKLDGQCLIGQTIFVRSPGIHIKGGSLIALNNFNLIQLQVNDVCIENVDFKGSTTDTERQFGIFTVAPAPKNVYIYNCSFSKTNSGVKLDTGASHWQVCNNYFSDLVGVTSGRGYGILVGAANYNLFHGNTFLGTPTSGRHAVYLSAGASYNIVSDNIADSFPSSAFPIYSKPNQPPCVHNKIQGNLAVNNGNRTTNDAAGIELTGVCQNNTILGNTIVNQGAHGIILSDANQGGGNQDNIIDGNTIDNAGWHGIYVKGPSISRIIIRNNVVRNSSQINPGVYRGIVLQTCEDVTLIGNISFGASQRDNFFLNQTMPLPVNTRMIANSWQPW
jgi:parallel beta-helix repeat protein